MNAQQELELANIEAKTAKVQADKDKEVALIAAEQEKEKAAIQAEQSKIDAECFWCSTGIRCEDVNNSCRISRRFGIFLQH